MLLNMKNILIYIILLIFTDISYSWELTLYIEDVNEEAADDYLILGICDICHDGFHYGEDQYDIPTGITPFTDIQFFNLDWLGDIDSNDNQCENPEFAVDKKSTHPPSDLLEWGIRGVAMGHTSPLVMTWEMEEFSDEYEIYMYIGDLQYNLRIESNIQLNPEDLPAIYEQIDGEWTSRDNIKILIGGCASTGTESYYIDNDQDGWGAGIAYDFCPGFQPEGYVDNNSDSDDSIFCLSDIIDDCDVCDGENADQDCAGVCFGPSTLDDCEVCDGENADQDCAGVCFGDYWESDCGCADDDDSGDDCDDCAGTPNGDALADDCEVCDGENQSCLDEIFYYLPYNVHALIDDDSIVISWNANLDLEEGFIQGFNLYHGNDETDIILFDTTQNTIYETTEFNDGFFCVSIYDNYDNESELTCTTATVYHLITYVLHEGANLVSFPYIPENDSVSFIFDDIKYELEGILGQGVATTYINGTGWVGSLTQINYSDGYWLKMNLDIEEINFNMLGFPSDEDVIYNLDEGYNLISYIGQDELLLEEAIPEGLSSDIISIIGEGQAAANIDGQWFGSLTFLNFGSGYWIQADSSIIFYWE